VTNVNGTVTGVLAVMARWSTDTFD
jgi:hypothetical protein